jgi:hypothetical protein
MLLNSSSTTEQFSSKAHRDKQFSRYAIGFCVNRSRPSGTKCGGNYVDVTLGVKVINTANSISVIVPEELHGTTPLVDCKSSGMMITFTQRLYDWFQKAVESGDWQTLLEQAEEEAD